MFYYQIHIFPFTLRIKSCYIAYKVAAIYSGIGEVWHSKSFAMLTLLATFLYSLYTYAALEWNCLFYQYKVFVMKDISKTTCICVRIYL